MRPEVTAANWARLSEFIASAMGLHFPPERWSDLQRGVTEAAVEFGFENVAACANWLLSAPLTKEQQQVLASHLTIGETYFFRDQPIFETLTGDILPSIIRSRRGREQRLRLWSAACCSGEEAYSLAIMLHQVLPDLKDWQVTILATDINPRFLRKAVNGVYGEWSFRNAPADLKNRYFIRDRNGRYEVTPDIKAMVTFSHLNLAQDSYPSLATDTNAMDVIFCRNVLMYFTPPQIQRAVANLHHSLVDGGWLAVSPSETSQVLFSSFAARNFPGAILYQKSSVPSAAEKIAPKSSRPTSVIKSVTPRAPAPVSERATGNSVTKLIPLIEATGLFEKGNYAEASALLTAAVTSQTRDPKIFSLLARSLANQGKLADALGWSDRWISVDKVDPAGHYLRAIILLEQGATVEARQSLQRAIYLSPTFVLAHFALGNLARGDGKSDEAARHFNNAKQLLARMQVDDLLPESDGLTAGRLTETIAALSTAEVVT